MPGADGIELTIPGSTSNLGAGFDALGLALALYLRVRIVSIIPDGRAQLTFYFDDAPLLDGENYIERAFFEMATRRGKQQLPSLDISVKSEIPLRAGLGSSAAAIVAGIRLFETVGGLVPMDEALAVAAHLEGHPDNTSASLLGGLTASCQTDDGVVAVATPWPPRIHVIIATPDLTLSTKVARGALPKTVRAEDAIFNLQRTAVLLQAIASHRYEVLREALRDRLHQPYRAPLVPGLEKALTFEHPLLLGVFLSGAGPSLAALTDGDAPEVEELFRRHYRDDLGLGSVVRTLNVHQPASYELTPKEARPF